MWNDSDPRRELRDHEVEMGRSSARSDVVVMDDRVMEAAARAQPGLTNINVTKSSRLHIGPKFVSVTQNIDNTEVVKGRILGLELVSPQNSKRLRCSIAVFVCWAFLVSSALTFFILHYALAKQEARLDIDLPLPRYLWDLAKSTTKAERLSCAVALIVLFLCILLIVYFTVIKKKNADTIDVAPHEWYINRDMWLAPEFDKDEDTTDEFDPLRLVIIAHTVSSECKVFMNCAAELRNLQGYYIKTYGYDIPFNFVSERKSGINTQPLTFYKCLQNHPAECESMLIAVMVEDLLGYNKIPTALQLLLRYNFLIGNDGRVYEGRGWNKVGAHTKGYNFCSLGLAFIGDYREGLASYSKVTELQLERAKMLLEEGVKLKHLHPYYHVLGAKDLKPTQSPGTNLYKAIQEWPNYNHENIYQDKSCVEIRDMFQNQTDVVGLTKTKKS